jgi:hypothetical protein
MAVTALRERMAVPGAREGVRGIFVCVRRAGEALP